MVKEQKNEDSNGDMPVQIISGRDGKPAFVVMPIDAFGELLARVIKGASESGKLPTSRDFGKLQDYLIFPGVDPYGAGLSKYLDETTSDQFKERLSQVLLLIDNFDASDDDDEYDIAAYDDAKARNEESFPLEVTDRMIGGDNPIKVFRQHRRLTQKQLAEKTDTSAAYLSQIETGRRAGSIKFLRRLANALDVEVEDLI